MISTQSRNSKVIDLMPLVRKMAFNLAKRLPPCIEVDDLVSEGTIGLMDALEKFDPKKGVALRSYAAWRVRGAMLDFLRRDDHLTRPQRERQKQEPEQAVAFGEEKAVPPLDELPGTDAGPFENLLAREVAGAIAEALRGLSLRERMIIERCDLREETQDRVAARLRCDPSRVSQLRMQAMKKMKTCMGESLQYLP